MYDRHRVRSVARLLYPNTLPAATRWYNQAATLLFQGHAEKIADTLATKLAQNLTLAMDEADTVITYFRNNHKRMQYMEFRKDGFLIGSGMVESAAKQFKARFTGPGMQWSRDRLQCLIPIRAAVLSHSFDKLWDSVFSSPLT